LGEELMAKFMNVVRYVVKADCHDEFIELHSSSIERGMAYMDN